MATADLNRGYVQRQEELDDMTTCCICTETYTDPKALPCIHTFCMKCLQENGLKTNKGPGDEMPCPICRRLFNIPTGGFHALPKNFFIEKLMQVARVSDQPASSKALCDACVEDNNEESDKDISVGTADKYCDDCKQKLCEKCSRQHRKFTSSKDHKLMPISEYESGQIVRTNVAPSVCELHRQKVMDTYCADCKTVVCANCFIDDHKNHEGSHVDKFVDDFRKQINSNADAINECSSRAQVKRADILKVEKDIHDRVKQLERDVEYRMDELKQLIDKHGTSLLQGLHSIRQSKLKEFQIATEEIDAYISCLADYNSYCQKMMDRGSAGDICRESRDLCRRAKELQQQFQRMIEREIQPIDIHLRKTEFDKCLGGRPSGDNLIGEFEENRNESMNLEKKQTQELKEGEQLKEKRKQRLLAELRYISDPILVHTISANSGKQLIPWFGVESKDIRGLTILDKELFIVSEKNSDVEVYNSIKFSICRVWNLKELIDPRDIVSCDKNKCLYILDCESFGNSRKILMVDPSGKLLTKWSTGVDDGIGLSVTVEANVILTAFDRNKLYEYSPEGLLIREIKLSSDADMPISHPLHAVKLTNDHFLVSHGRYRGDLHRLCIVDANGKLKKSFGGICGSTIEQMNYPIHLSVDGNRFVMVVDQENRRVLLLNSDLKFQREILSKDKHELLCPTRILLDESNSRLFVADNASSKQRILIFEFK